MGDNNESIGGISVEVVGDYSKLQADLEGAQQVAAEAGAHIASALNEGATGADALTGAISAASVGMESFEAQIEALVASGSTLAEALAAVQGGAEEIATGVSAAGEAAAEAAGQMELFDAAIEVPYADAAGQLNMFASELEPIPAAAREAAAAAEELAQGEKAAGESAHEAAGGLSELGEKLVAFGEALLITEGLKEFGTEALHAADNITRASISLTALTDSGEKAERTIQQIEALGIRDGLSLPALLQASTRMTALLGASAPVPELLAKIADGAAVMGSDINRAADSFDRLATMGTLGARQLMPLGLSLESIAASMNDLAGNSDATAANVGKLFKAMDQGDRIKVLSDALDNLGGIAQEVAEKTFGGQWQILANQWEQVMRNVGDVLLPVITELTDLMKVDVLPFLKDVSEAFKSLPEPVRDGAVAVGLLAAAVVPVTLAIGGMGLALSAASAAIAPVGAALVSLGGALTGAGASYTAMLATGIASAAVWVGLAVAIVDVAHAYYTMSQAQDNAAKAQDAAAASLQVYELKLREHGIDISALREQYQQGAISVDEYRKGLNKLRDEYLATHPVLQEHAAATTVVFNASEALRIKMSSLADAVTATRDKLAATTAAYDAHKATAQDVAKAYDAWQAATGALKSAQEALLPVVTNIHHATRDFVDIVLTIPTAQKAAIDSQDALNIKWAEQNTALGLAQAYLDQVLERYREGKATAQEVAKALDTVNQMQAALNQTTAQFKLPEAFATWPEFLKQTQRELTALQPPLAAIPQYVRTAADALHDMGIKTDDAGHAAMALVAAYEELGTKTHTIEDEDVAWAKVSSTLGKLSKTDLPTVLKLYDEHLAQLHQLGASEGVILAAQADQLKTQIAIAEQSGVSATKQIIDLNNVKLHQQALYDQTHLLGDLYVGIQNDILKGWDSMGKAIADNIIDENDWGQTFMNVGKQVAKMILEEIVGSAFKALKDAIIGTSTSVVNLQSEFTKLAKSITDAFGGAASSGAGAASGGAGAAGAASGLGGAVSVVGAIGSIGTMISSIIGNFQMARLETTMNAVEHNTRFLQIEAEKFFQVDEWQRHGEVLAHFDGIFQRLGDIWDSINTAATEIVAAIAGIVSIGGSDKPATAGAQGLSSGLTSHLTNASATVPTAGAAPFSAVSPGGYGTMASPSAATYNSATTTTQSGPQSLSVTINEAGNARNTARELSGILKVMTPSFAAFAK